MATHGTSGTFSVYDRIIWDGWTNGTSTSTGARIVRSSHNLETDTWDIWVTTGTYTTTTTLSTTLTESFIDSNWQTWIHQQVVQAQDRMIGRVMTGDLRAHRPSADAGRPISRPADLYVSDEVAARAAPPAERALILAIEKRKRLKPIIRARRLLVDHLNKEQRAQFKKDESFIVVGGQSGKKYRVNKGRTANIQELGQDDRVVRRLCAHPGIQCPDFDTMLTQKIMLEHMEADFVRTANVH